MINRPAFPVDEVRGRLLYDALLAEARCQVGRWCDGVPVTIPPHQESPVIPTVSTTDTGTMRAIVVAV